MWNNIDYNQRKLRNEVIEPPPKLENKRKNTFKNSKLQRTQKKLKTAQQIIPPEKKR